MTRPEEDLAEELARGDHLDPDERDLEAPPADAAEQATAANPVEQPTQLQRGLEVGEWDAFEQAIVVDLDQDDYDR